MLGAKSWVTIKITFSLFPQAWKTATVSKVPREEKERERMSKTKRVEFLDLLFETKAGSF